MDDESIIERILDDIIIRIEENNKDERVDDEDNVDLLKSKVKTLEYKCKLTNEENLNLSKLYEGYKKEREESYEKVIKVLSEKLEEKEKDVLNYEVKLNESEVQKQQHIDQLHLDFKKQFEQAFKKFQEMQKDKTSMVMKYAEAEKRCMDLSRTNEHLQTRINDFLKEKQRILEKLEVKNQEKLKFNAEYELKLNEISNLNKQIEKLKETNVFNEVKLNKLESKYKNECENNIENKKLIEKLNIQLVKLRNSIIKKDQEDSATAGDGDTSAANISQQELLNINLNLNDDDTDGNSKYLKISHDYNQLNIKYKQLMDEFVQIKGKFNSIENENKANIIQMQSYKEALNSQNKMNKDLLSENLQLRELQVTLTK